MKHCPNPDCPHVRAVRVPAEYVDEIAGCADCGAVLVAGAVPEPAQEEASLPLPAPLLRRLAVTLAVIPAYLALRRVPIPGVDAEAAMSPNASVFSLGIGPFVTAAAVVGLALLAVPRWRDLGEHPAGRRRLALAAVGLTVVFALSQAFALAQLLAGLPDWYSGSLPVTVMTLAAGAVLFVAAAEALSRHALGNGYALLIGAGILGPVIERVAATVAASDEANLAWLAALPLSLAVTAAVGYVLSRALRARPIADRRRERGPDAYRHNAAAVDAGEVAVHAPPFVRLFACGVAPLVAVSYLTGTILPYVGVDFRHVAGPAYAAVQAGLVAAIALFFSFGLHPAPRVASLWFRDPSAAGYDAGVAALRAEVRRSALKSASLLAGLAGLTAYAGPRAALSSVGLVVLTTLAMDLADEWRARRAHADLSAVAELHDPDAAEAALAALAEAGVPAHTRGLHLRAALQVFGAYVPVVIFVGEEHVKAAKAALEALRPAKEEEEVAAKPRRRKRAKAKRPAES